MWETSKVKQLFGIKLLCFLFFKSLYKVDIKITQVSANATIQKPEEEFLKLGKLEYLTEEANLTFNWHFQQVKNKKIISSAFRAFF